MPELPDVTVYVEALARRIVGAPLERIRLGSPFVLRSVTPPVAAVNGRTVRGVERLGKRIIVELDGELFVVLHLMISGRLQWRDPGAKVPGKVGLAAFDFPDGTLTFTEASTRKRASLHLVEGRSGLAEFDRGGLEVLAAPPGAFAAALRRENHTLKRTLTDPRIFSGIGNAYSDEILHRAQLSPLRLSTQLPDAEVARLERATREVLTGWTERLREEVGEGFPEKVTAFREGMAVHGRYGQPCPVCGGRVARIVYAENEANYCPRCQTEGKLLADRSLSRLMKDDWPRTIDELEQKLGKPQPGPNVSAAAPLGAPKPPARKRKVRLPG